MLDRRGSPVRSTDRYQIKPILIVRPPVPEHPDRSHASDVALLAPADRLEGGSADCRVTGLHLDKGDRAALSDYQVDIVPP
jgi:hypothetical protein